MWWSTAFDQHWVVSLLPGNATPWELAVEAVDADLVARDPIGLIAASRLHSEVPAQWLAYLAEERSVDEFSSAWPEERQRAVTAASFPTHQVKGTRPAIDRALLPLGFSPRVVEWFEVTPRRQQNTFRIAITIDQDREWLGGRSEIIRVANKAKNAHTKLEAIEYRRNAGPATTFVGGITRRQRTLRVGQLPRIETIRLPAMTYVAAAQTRRRTLRIGPRI